MALQAFSTETGERVHIGDTVIDFRGDRATLARIDEASGPGRAGKITVTERMGQRYANVFGLYVRDVQ